MVPFFRLTIFMSFLIGISLQHKMNPKQKRKLQIIQDYGYIEGFEQNMEREIRPNSIQNNQLIPQVFQHNKLQEEMYQDMDKYERQKQMARDPRFRYGYKAAVEFQELRNPDRSLEDEFGRRLRWALWRNYPVYRRERQRVETPPFAENLQTREYLSTFRPYGSANIEKYAEQTLFYEPLPYYV